MGLEAPLVLTAWFDDVAFERLDELRQRHFPAEKNHLRAHLTLFHALPGEEEGAIAMDLDSLAKATAPFAMKAAGLRSLGRGVAIRMDGTEIMRLRKELAVRFDPFLTAQDRQKIAPHVTIQNKVSELQAEVLLQELSADFQPFAVRCEGFILHRYLNGPWKELARFPFSGASSSRDLP